MPDDIVSAVVIALARTWDKKLPGFLSDFKREMGIVYVQIPSEKTTLRATIDLLIRELS
jgi:hypothetical protein